MNKFDVWCYFALFVGMVILSFYLIGEEKKKPKEVNIINKVVKVEVIK